jgi:hypothetical protein
MSLVKYYTAIEKAEDAQAALPYLFQAAGDSTFTADKRVGECFFTRGRGRKMDPELFSPVQTSYEVGEDDLTEETVIEKEIISGLNSYLEGKIQVINDEYESEGRVTKSMRSLILDLKSIYAQILSRIAVIQDLKDFSSPLIDDEPWASEWTQDHLINLKPLVNFSEKEIYSTDKGETKLLKNIKDKVSYDRYKILDNLIEYFKDVSRGDIAEYIMVNEFKFISDSSTSIIETHSLTEEDFHVVNAARVTFISRRKIDLNYALELVNIPSTTYKKRSGKIKLELLDLGEEIGNGTNNKMQDYLLD